MAQRHRKQQGTHHLHVQKKMVQEVHERAVQRRQPFPWRRLVLSSISFMAFCTLLFMYLNYLAEEEEEEVVEQQPAAE